MKKLVALTAVICILALPVIAQSITSSTPADAFGGGGGGGGSGNMQSFIQQGGDYGNQEYCFYYGSCGYAIAQMQYGAMQTYVPLPRPRPVMYRAHRRAHVASKPSRKELHQLACAKCR